MDADLESLMVFRTLAQTGSFTESGKRWGMSQPAVSLLIGKLEASFGLILLERGNGVQLTEAGRRVLVQVEEIHAAYHGFADGIHSLGRRIDREVAVGFDASWFGETLRRRLASEPCAGPVSPVFLDAGEDWEEALESNRCDVVIAGRFAGPTPPPAIQEVVLRRERGLTVAWNPDFHPLDPVRFNFPELLRTTVLMPERRVVSGFAGFLHHWCERAYGRQPIHTIRFQSEAEAATACEAGLGVLLAPGDAIPRLGGIGFRLTSVRTFEFLLPDAYTLGVYCRSDEESKDVLAVAAAVVSLARACFSLNDESPVGWIADRAKESGGP